MNTKMSPIVGPTNILLWTAATWLLRTISSKLPKLKRALTVHLLHWRLARPLLGPTQLTVRRHCSPSVHFIEWIWRHHTDSNLMKVVRSFFSRYAVIIVQRLDASPKGNTSALCLPKRKLTSFCQQKFSLCIDVYYQCQPVDTPGFQALTVTPCNNDDKAIQRTWSFEAVSIHNLVIIAYVWRNSCVLLDWFPTSTHCEHTSTMLIITSDPVWTLFFLNICSFH